MLKWFPRLQVSTPYLSCSPPDLSFLDPYFTLMYMHNNHCHRETAHLQLNKLLLLSLLILYLNGFVNYSRRLKAYLINHSKPSCHIMYQQFNILNPTGHVIHQQV
jgi:hypothetical protein